MRPVLVASIIVLILVGSIAASFYLSIRTSRVAFTLNVYPSELKGDAVAGQKVVLLVTVANDESGGNLGAVKISVRAPNSSVSVEPQSISPGQIGEVTVIPGIESVGNNVTVTVSAERDGLTRSGTVEFAVVPGEDSLGDYARQLREVFVSWLQANHPELGITNQTEWMGTVVSPHWLVVSHYLFFSKNWEIHLYWHIMIPPYDWARIDLRQRFTQLNPALSFEIPSLNASVSPQAIAPPETTWR